MTLEQKIARAKQIRRMAMINAETLEDSQAAEIRTLYPEWKPGETVEPGDNMADSWEALDVEHAGTIDDPIPAKPNMRYYPGKYYLDGGRVYRCTRDTEQAIAQLPHELVGVYFEEAE